MHCSMYNLIGYAMTPTDSTTNGSTGCMRVFGNRKAVTFGELGGSKVLRRYERVA